METPEGPAAAASGTSQSDIPTFEELAADPEIAALLDFEPVPRKSSPPGAWTPEAQRQFIAWLAVIGSQGKACGRIGKDRGGATKLYNSPHGASFRAAWHGAIELFERRQSERIGDGPPPATRPPTIDGRRKYPHPIAPPHAGEGQDEGDQDNEEPQTSREEDMRIAEYLVGAFMKKVGAERRARLDGEIVAADFYLRQLTFVEVMFDLTVERFGEGAYDAFKVLSELRRGDHHVIDIVATPLTELLDAIRREWWLREDDPERPPHPDPRFVKRHDSGPWGSRGPEGYSTELQQHATGSGTTRRSNGRRWGTTSSSRRASGSSPRMRKSSASGSAAPTPSMSGGGIRCLPRGVGRMRRSGELCGGQRCPPLV